MILGSHLSIAGGAHKALEKAADYHFNAVALFVRNQVQWRCKPLTETAIDTFCKTRKELGIQHVVAHGSYLVNLAGNPEVREKSIAAMIVDVMRCAQFGIEKLVFHPGSNPNRDDGIRLIAEALSVILKATRNKRVKILLETTAGQGSCIGHRFEDIAEILKHSPRSKRLGVCMDTCHSFAAGYDYRTPDQYQAVMEQFDQIIGFNRLKAIHLNDSKRTIGSRVDRHEHIGRGAIGISGFRNLVNDPRLARIPMILETPKGKDARGMDWDVINTETLKSLRSANASS